MDIEKIYEDTKKKMAQHSSLEENKFMGMIKKQDKMFFTTLKELVEYYPHNKVKDTTATNSKYSTLLSSLNGITNKLKSIHTNITEKIKIYGINMEHDQKDINNLKQIYKNLSSYTDLEHLDASSKRMLKDYISTYSTQYTVFWIKLILFLFFMYQLIQDAFDAESHNGWFYIGIWFLLMFILYMVSMIKSKMQTVIMPTSATATAVAPTTTDCSANTISMESTLDSESTCYDSVYGCCPDGITNSNEDGTNCNAMTVKPNACATTQYGCCPDGTTVSVSDGSNCIKGCSNSKYGCCPNGITISNKDRSNCDVAGCAGTEFGCCPDGTASNHNRTNCQYRFKNS
jgi:hypothetical protein